MNELCICAHSPELHRFISGHHWCAGSTGDSTEVSESKLMCGCTLYRPASDSTEGLWKCEQCGLKSAVVIGGYGCGGFGDVKHHWTADSTEGQECSECPIGASLATEAERLKRELGESSAQLTAIRAALEELVEVGEVFNVKLAAAKKLL